MDKGYIKLWRKTKENSSLFNNPFTWTVFSHLLLRAEWKDGRKIWDGKTEIELKAGQCTFGRFELSKECGMTVTQTREATKRLITARTIAIKTTTKFSIVTIINWDIYQQTENLTATNNSHKQQPTNSQPTATLKEVKNRRIKENTSFEVFWSKYPRKVGKEQARKSFEKLGCDELLLKTLLSSVDAQRGSDQWQKDNGVFIPHASTWLNNKRWEDELTNVKRSPYDGLPKQNF